MSIIKGPALENLQPLDVKMSPWLADAIGYKQHGMERRASTEKPYSPRPLVRRVDENPEFLEEVSRVLRTAEAYVKDLEQVKLGFTGLDSSDIDAFAKKGEDEEPDPEKKGKRKRHHNIDDGEYTVDPSTDIVTRASYTPLDEGDFEEVI